MAVGLCKLCGKEKTLLYYETCDSCYRNKIAKVYNQYRLKKEHKDINKVKNKKHREVLRMAIWYDKNQTEISNILKIPQRTISTIINRYCYRCDIYGNPRPQEFNVKGRSR